MPKIFLDPEEQRGYVRSLQKTILDITQPAKVRRQCLKQFTEAKQLEESLKLLRRIYKEPKCQKKTRRQSLSSRKK
jgi:hypothetical protein